MCESSIALVSATPDWFSYMGQGRNLELIEPSFLSEFFQVVQAKDDKCSVLCFVSFYFVEVVVVVFFFFDKFCAHQYLSGSIWCLRILLVGEYQIINWDGLFGSLLCRERKVLSHLRQKRFWAIGMSSFHTCASVSQCQWVHNEHQVTNRTK